MLTILRFDSMQKFSLTSTLSDYLTMTLAWCRNPHPEDEGDLSGENKIIFKLIFVNATHILTLEQPVFLHMTTKVTTYST